MGMLSGIGSLVRKDTGNGLWVVFIGLGCKTMNKVYDMQHILYEQPWAKKCWNTDNPHKRSTPVGWKANRFPSLYSSELVEVQPKPNHRRSQLLTILSPTSLINRISLSIADEDNL
ncbi:hypothetical protein PTTG_04706 [Puccinia triticina 1-1 BBBD Race 1]|uniref:Uncharacterized protein n=1 Tax=Puccinia triticina (isolate 1-1 / race 1 (BBBD)) TaxID=630390 RepID=A0A180GEZ3_PUCT1|nr:hypothetical protein PTTG_04706 [Puccinia triticina 1-1 BBBD Race 1]